MGLPMAKNLLLTCFSPLDCAVQVYFRAHLYVYRTRQGITTQRFLRKPN